MTRLVLALATGLTLGLLVHLVTVMAVPRVADQDGWSRALAFAEPEGVTLLPPARPDSEALPLLDPALAYAVCRIDLSQGPMLISAPMPRAFWSLALYSREHGVYYAVTQEAAPTEMFEIELRNAAQMRRFRMTETQPDTETLTIEVPADTGLAVFRALAQGRSGRGEAEAHLASIDCGRLPETTDPERPDPFPFPRPRPPELS